jgi:O-antigen ligase
MNNALTWRIVLTALILFCLAGGVFFYYKYVPLIPYFQLALIPILCAAAVLTAANIRWGVLFFVFSFPLVNNLPYFFGINERTPHAPTALVLFMAFFLGWLVGRVFAQPAATSLHRIFKPLALFSALILLSAIITFFRYANFFPFLSERICELIVNARDVRAGGALMSVVFSSLNYLSGFLFFFILYTTVKTRKFGMQLLLVLSTSVFISLVFSLVQKYYSIKLGNSAFWIRQSRINATYKDANSFALYLAVFLPLFLGIFFAANIRLRSFSFLSIILILLVFPATGSRSGFLALSIALAVFFVVLLVSRRRMFRIRIANAFLALLVLLLFLQLFIVFFGGSILSDRINKSLHLAAQQGTLNQLFAHRLHFWKGATSMIRDYPFTGVGVGAYIVELPNYSKLLGLPVRFTDSAENYPLQIVSELGLIGLLVLAWVCFEVFLILRNGLRTIRGGGREQFILVGIFSGLVAYFVTLFFHSYIGSYEAKYLLWLLVTCFLVFSGKATESDKKAKFGGTFWIAAGLVLALFGTIHVWNSVRSLSIPQRTELLGWKQNYGLYQLEKDNQGNPFFWIKKSAGITLDRSGMVFKIAMKAAHPDIEKNPVTVRVYSADRYFSKKSLLQKVVLKDGRWVDCEFFIKDMPPRFQLVFETDRDWQPLRSLGVSDPRWIAIGLSRARFQ